MTRILLRLTIFFLAYSAVWTACELKAQAATPTLADDVQVARDYWGWQRSLWCSSETFEEGPVSLGVAGETHFVGVETRFPEGVEEVPCQVVIRPIASIEEMIALNLPGDAYPVPVRARELRCRIMVHEYGHVLHLDHVEDESSPMFWKLTFKPVLPGCEARLHEQDPVAVPTPRPRPGHHHRRHFRVNSPLGLLRF